MDTQRLAHLLRESFAPILNSESIDVRTDPERQGVTVATEEWKVKIHGWPERPVALVELTDAGLTETIPGRREEVMAYEIDEAFAYVDLQTGGRVRQSLLAADNEASADLAQTMAEIQQRFVASGVEVVPVTA